MREKEKDKMEISEFIIDEERFEKVSRIGDEILDIAGKKEWDIGDFYFAIQLLLAMSLKNISRQKRQKIYRQIEKLSEMEGGMKYEGKTKMDIGC